MTNRIVVDWHVIHDRTTANAFADRLANASLTHGMHTSISDGIELARRSAEIIPGLKVLFITGFAAVALHARQSGPTADTKVLSKPFHLRDLVGEVDKILAA